MDIKDLKYLALEGGGGKGVVYLGAIRAIEKKCYEDWMYGKLLKKENGILKAPTNIQKEIFLENHITKKDNEKDEFEKATDFIPSSIIDYYNTDTTPKIQGIAGSSAGAVTAFALALGLNSKQIEAVLKYSFEEFLTEEDVGKYRAVGQNSFGRTVLYVGQDKKKVGGDLSEKYEYDFKNIKKVKGNFIKNAKRRTLLTIIVDVLGSGIQQKFDLIQRIFSQKDFKIASNHTFVGIIEQFIKTLGVPGNTYFEKSGLRKNISKGVLYQSFFFLIRKLVPFLNKPITINFNVIGNLIWDRGAFSGFKVREFFFDVILFAITRDTHFQRGFLKHLEKQSKTPLTQDKINEIKDNLNSIDIKAENWFKTERDEKMSQLEKDTIEAIEILKSISFKEFNEITKIDIGFNVTNFTTGSPMFFSHKHTPDFPILEAVAAAMSIPPAIKPLYNEADVYKPKNIYNPNKIKVYVDGNATDFVNEKGNFSLDNYYLYEVAVKKYLSKNNKNKINIDTNNPMNRSAFLDPLREAAFSSETTSKDIKIGNQNIKITRELLIFFYNAAYKGMFMDGGATCNIPYNYFRDNSKANELSLEGVLALKLDNGFPEEWIQQFRKVLELAKTKLKKSNLLEQLDKEQRSLLGNLIRLQLKVFFISYNKKAKSALEGKGLIDKIENLTKTEWENISEGLVKHVRSQNNNIKPWQKQKSIFGLIDTLQYGSEEGQVKYLSDHNHIVPLFCYGIGVYDFDMKKIPNLIDIAVDAAEIQANNIFKPKDV